MVFWPQTKIARCHSPFYTVQHVIVANCHNKRQEYKVPKIYFMKILIGFDTKINQIISLSNFQTIIFMIKSVLYKKFRNLKG